MFDREQFIADCRSLLGGERAAHGVREIVARAVSAPEHPAEIAAAINI